MYMLYVRTDSLDRERERERAMPVEGTEFFWNLKVIPATISNFSGKAKMNTEP